MVNIVGDKTVQKVVSKYFLAKDFFVITDVYFQNMAIRNCDYARQAARQAAIRLSVFLKT